MCHDGDKNICCGDERNEDDATENVYEKLSDTLADKDNRDHIGKNEQQCNRTSAHTLSDVLVSSESNSDKFEFVTAGKTINTYIQIGNEGEKISENCNDDKASYSDSSDDAFESNTKEVNGYKTGKIRRKHGECEAEIRHECEENREDCDEQGDRSENGQNDVGKSYNDLDDMLDYNQLHKDQDKNHEDFSVTNDDNDAAGQAKKICELRDSYSHSKNMGNT